MGKLKKNSIAALAAQIVNIICAFILPRLILSTFGSDINGLVNSITQFLQIIGLLELGVGAVVESSLYKPLSEQNNLKLSQIMTSATKFYKKIAIALLIYAVGLVMFYPATVGRAYPFFDVIILIIALSANSFAQYYFGMINALLLNADQRSYIIQTLAIIATIANTAISVLLIYLGCSIQVVKVVSAVVLFSKPVFLANYIKRHYQINYHEAYDVEPIPQKWYGIAQHMAHIVLDSTDVVVLTIFSGLSSVSVYSVYNLVTNGMRSLVLSVGTGMQSIFGELIAKKEKDKLDAVFARLDWLIHTAAVVCFGCTMALVVPFVQIYTKGITDINYVQPLFAFLISLAQCFRCIRLPYNVMILAGGHYKETQSNYIVAALLNITISVLTVIRFGLVGVAIGTLAAFVYQNVWMAYYISKHIVCWPFKNFIRQTLIDLITLVCGYAMTRSSYLGELNYVHWALNGILTLVIWVALSMIINFIFYRERLQEIYNRYFMRFKA